MYIIYFSLALTLTLTLVTLHVGSFLSTPYLVSATLTQKYPPQPPILGMSAGEIPFRFRVALAGQYVCTNVRLCKKYAGRGPTMD